MVKHEAADALRLSEDLRRQTYFRENQGLPALYKIISDAIKNIDFEHKIDLQQLEEQ